MPDPERFAMRDIADGLLKSAEGTDLGRVADVEITLDDDGTARLTALIVGPEALAGRVFSWLPGVVRRLCHGRFEYRISIDEVEEFGHTIQLRHDDDHYEFGPANDDWVYNHIVRFIPGSGTR